LGAQRAMVVHAHDGLDELTLTAKTRVVHIHNGQPREETVDPQSLGLRACSIEDLQATDVEHAATILHDVFAAKDTVHTDMVILTTAGALIVAGVCDSFAQGIQIARDTIVSGRAMQTLDSLITASNG
ncbi:MAG: hypothetical protein JKY96_06095, partial [Phycisphaerales bacterium]|nr:hypothetical protein [Phycisphaerales bacterium]